MQGLPSLSIFPTSFTGSMTERSIAPALKAGTGSTCRRFKSFCFLQMTLQGNRVEALSLATSQSLSATEPSVSIRNSCSLTKGWRRRPHASPAQYFSQTFEKASRIHSKALLRVPLMIYHPPPRSASERLLGPLFRVWD